METISDLTRTIPVSGKFTARQKAVYEAVLRVKKEATKMLVPGTLWKKYHVEVGKIMTSELLGLGLLNKKDVDQQNPTCPYKRYFMHGTSHHMGLDTHDYGLLHLPCKPIWSLPLNLVFIFQEEGFGTV